MEWKDRQVEIIFDADARNDASIKRARGNLTRHLTLLGAKARLLEMPDLAETGGKGIDDLLGARGAAFVADWLRQARQATIRTGKTKAPGGEVFEVRDDGVYALDPAGQEPPIFVCSLLEILADTRDERSENWGRLLRFPDRDGRIHSWAMPASLLNGFGDEYRGELLRLGLVIGSTRRAQSLADAVSQFKGYDEGAGRCTDGLASWRVHPA